MVDATNSDTAQALTDALAAPGTPQELAREAEYVGMFLAVQAERRHGGPPATASAPQPLPLAPPVLLPVTDPEPSPLAFFAERAAAQVAGAPAGVRRGAPGAAARRHRRRLAMVAGLAAVAVTGTAAAVTTTLVNRAPAPPPQSTGPRPGTSEASSRTPGGTPGVSAPAGAIPTAGATPTAVPGPSVAPGASTAPGAGGPTTAPPAAGATVPSGSTVTTGSIPATSSSAPAPATSGPEPSPRDTGATPRGQLIAACKQFAKGKLDPGSPKYEALAAAAGGEQNIAAYCADLTGG